jgi:ABC-type Mn2+/Zn2+ transport system permease subunit
MLNALVAGIFVSVICGIIGTYMVLRGLAFIGDALAHGVLPGIVQPHCSWGSPGLSELRLEASR